MKKAWWIVLIVIVIAVGVYLVLNKNLVQFSPAGNASTNVTAQKNVTITNVTLTKSILQCKSATTYSKAYHSGGCKAIACSPGIYAGCNTKSSGFMGQIKSYSEVCAKTYTTACSASPACNVSYTQVSKASC